MKALIESQAEVNANPTDSYVVGPVCMNHCGPTSSGECAGMDSIPAVGPHMGIRNEPGPSPRAGFCMLSCCRQAELGRVYLASVFCILV